MLSTIACPILSSAALRSDKLKESFGELSVFGELHGVFELFVSDFIYTSIIRQSSSRVIAGALYFPYSAKDEGGNESSGFVVWFRTLPLIRFGRLKQARADAGLTQVEVAMKLRRPQSFVSKIESGERRVDVVELSELAKLYRRPLDFFLP